MAIEVTCQCGRSFQAKEEHQGRRARCQGCGGIIEIPKKRNTISPIFDEMAEEEYSTQNAKNGGTLEEIKDLLMDLSRLLQSRGNASADTTMIGQRQYKVLTQKDKWFSGKFDPEKLEQAINAYAGQGWIVKGITTASIPGFGGNREELIVLLER